MLDDLGTPALSPWQGQTYYGRRSLKPAPFNNWVVGGYIFLAGLGGKVSLLTGIADAMRPEGAEPMIRRGRFLPLLVPTLGAGLLVWDLHTPQRFYNMFRIAKVTSPMNIGTWILSGYSVSAIASAALQLLADRSGRQSRAAAWANAPAAVLGAGMGTYTASLLAATSTPLWAAAPKALAGRFASAAFASAAAMLGLFEHEGPTRRALDTVAATALVSELAFAVAMDRTVRAKGIGSALEGGWSMVEKVGATGIGAALPAALYGLSALTCGGGNLSRIASLLTLGGSFLLRVSVMQAGNRSASTPSIAFRFAQPDNLPTPPRLPPSRELAQLRAARARAARRERQRARVARRPPTG